MGAPGGLRRGGRGRGRAGVRGARRPLAGHDAHREHDRRPVGEFDRVGEPVGQLDLGQPADRYGVGLSDVVGDAITLSVRSALSSCLFGSALGGDNDSGGTSFHDTTVQVIVAEALTVTVAVCFAVAIFIRVCECVS